MLGAQNYNPASAIFGLLLPGSLSLDLSVRFLEEDAPVLLRASPSSFESYRALLLSGGLILSLEQVHLSFWSSSQGDGSTSLTLAHTASNDGKILLQIFRIDPTPRRPFAFTPFLVARHPANPYKLKPLAKN